MTYDTFQQGPGEYIPIIIASLLLTLVAYGAFPLIFARVRKQPITKNKYTLICYGFNFFINLIFIIISVEESGQATSGGAYLLWTFVFTLLGARVLKKRSILAGSAPRVKPNITKDAITPNEETHTDNVAKTTEESLTTESETAPYRICLSYASEETSNKHGCLSDLQLEKDNASAVEEKGLVTEDTLNKKNKFCSRCGKLIDSETKKCTGCGKQYFKGIPWEKMPIVGLVLILIASCALNVYQHQEMKEIEFNAKMHQSEIKELTNNNKELNQEITDLSNDLDACEAKLAFYDEAVVFVEDDGTNLYHKYECDRFIGSSFWAYNIENAEYKGYEPCDLCYKTNNPTDSLTEEFYQAQAEREQTSITSNTVGVRTISFTDEFTAKYIYAKLENSKNSEEDIVAILDEYGSNQGGGQLYVIEPGYFVEEVDSWCFDPSRKRGDVAIIENAYGYSVCYFSGWL